MAMVPPMAYHSIPTASHGVVRDSLAPWRVLWHAMGGAVATPAATVMGLHVNLTAWYGNPYGTPMSTAPRVRLKVRARVRVRVRVPWYAVEARGRFRGMAREM